MAITTVYAAAEKLMFGNIDEERTTPANIVNIK